MVVLSERGIAVELKKRKENLQLHFEWETHDIANSVCGQPPSWTSEYIASLSVYHWNLSEGLSETPGHENCY